MATPTLRPASDPAPLGALIRAYPCSPTRFIWLVLWSALSEWCVVGSLVQRSVGGVMVGLALGAGCYAYYYYYARHDVHAEIIERGYVISRGCKTTTAWCE